MGHCVEPEATGNAFSLVFMRVLHTLQSNALPRHNLPSTYQNSGTSDYLARVIGAGMHNKSKAKRQESSNPMLSVIVISRAISPGETQRVPSRQVK
ncbi:hypothetical protein PoB_000276900 [Plakobranchus ocellatus]|uniref:Uncharacterized protein n=1 Tax=Plakobranchus ocellatus TaxID=259542 RepID=A0AAV3Y1Y7_9GAST|nr:hypothetical protein PoB_000276900 [Plakobranchus ocellatus]